MHSALDNFFFKLLAGKSSSCFGVPVGSAKAARLGRLQGHCQEQCIPQAFGLCVHSAVFKNRTSRFHHVGRKYFWYHRLQMDCNQRETNRAHVTPSWIQTNNVYCTKRLWGYILRNLPLVFFCIFSIWLKTILFKPMLSEECGKCIYDFFPWTLKIFLKVAFIL